MAKVKEFDGQVQFVQLGGECKKTINQMISDFGIGGDEQKTGMKENRE